MGMRERLRRADWLGELNVVLMIGIALAGVSTARLMLSDTVYVDVPASHAIGEATTPRLRAGAAVGSDNWLQVRIDDPTIGQVALGALRRVPELLLALLVLVLLRRIVSAARHGRAFTPPVSRLLSILGGVVVIGGLVVTILRGIADYALTDQVSTVGPAASLDLNLAWLLTGFGFLAIGEVVRRGTAMRAELDEVI